MTKHLENSDTSLVFHCVQGKDRYVERWHQTESCKLC
jgi:hypothetical protein